MLRNSHQAAEPRNTPATSQQAAARSPPAATTPRPAKMAANDRIVIGFVMVRKNVET